MGTRRIVLHAVSAHIHFGAPPSPDLSLSHSMRQVPWDNAAFSNMNRIVI